MGRPVALVIEDEYDISIIFARALRQAGYGGHTVREAGDGDEALRAIEEKRPGLVLCDWNMPGMSGIELLERLNADGLRTRLGFVTSEGTDDVRKRARDAGAAFFVSKPVTAEKLQQALEKVLVAA